MVTASAKLIEQLLQEAEQAAEPAGLDGDNVVHKPDEALPVPMVAHEVTSAGYVYIYDTRTAERSIVNRNMLSAQLKYTRPDGSLVFTTDKPKVGPIRGTFICLLHESRPEWPRYAAMGWDACRKANMPSQHQVLMHMQHDHKVEYATIQEEQRRVEREEDREFQRSLLSAARSAGPETPAPAKAIKRRRRNKA